MPHENIAVLPSPETRRRRRRSVPGDDARGALEVDNSFGLTRCECMCFRKRGGGGLRSFYMLCADTTLHVAVVVVKRKDATSTSDVGKCQTLLNTTTAAKVQSWRRCYCFSINKKKSARRLSTASERVTFRGNKYT